ncbi:MAG TPA: type II toxin-antitoxin system HicB family antitoxin [Bryobacteraceae bacterium]|nr:type II toxin-antitoxin system HicB family antitoxin [Bryobacteraceae bacterium]
MELAIRIEVQQLPEGVYLATSEELPGLVAQGRTIAETLEIARDVARRLIEARREREGDLSLPASRPSCRLCLDRLYTRNRSSISTW